MALLNYLIIAAFCLLPIALILMLITNTKYTKGSWRTFIGWLVISGVLMSIYLFASVLSKTEFAANYAAIINIIGFIAVAVAAIARVAIIEPT